MKRFRRTLTLYLGMWFFCLALEAIVLEHMPVERLDLQAKLLRAVLKFSTPAPDRLVVAVVYIPEASNIARNVLDEIQKLDSQDLPVTAMLVPSNDLEKIDATVNVMYITPGQARLLDQIATIAKERQIFSVTGVPEYVDIQKIALGFDEYKGKPQIILCLPVAKMTGYEFKHPNFLNLQTTRKLRLIK